MEPRTLQLLEFPKVLQRLAQLAVSEPGQAACLELAPLAEPEVMAHAAAFTRQGLRFVQETTFHLSPFPGLEGLLDYLRRPQGLNDLLDLDELWALLQVLGQARTSLKLFGDEDPRWPLLCEWAEAVEWPGKTFSGLSRCIGPDGLLRDESSPALFQVRSDIRRIHQQCTRRVKDFLQQQSITHYLQDEYMTISSDRYVVPLKSNFKGRLPGVIHDYSQTGETCYFEPMFLVDLNNQLQELKQEEREAEREVLRLLTGLARQELAAVERAYAFLVDLDLLLAKAAFAKALNGTLLEFDSDAPLCLRQARHPLLALAGDKVVPLDIELLPGQRGMIISGGNAGGKTVCLKTVGLIALMAATGLPTPVAEGSRLPVWPNIFVSIGDEQSLEDNVSTFTAQIRHLSRVWERIDGQTLVILDEFGAGTDPSQGAALAQALMDSLLEAGAHVAAATHFPALKAYALARDDVRATSVLFDPGTKRPLFRLAYDQVGASHALDVAREHGLPEVVLERAQQYLLLDGSDTGGLMDRLNSLAEERDREIRRLDDERKRLEERRKTLAERYEREKRTLLEDLKKQSQEILRQWQSQKLSHKQAMKELAKTREQLAPQREEEREAPVLSLESLEVGESVLYLPWGKKGQVQEIDQRKSQIKVDLNGVAMWAPLTDLAPANQPASGGGSRTPVKAEAAGSLTLDIRGQRADQALAELARFMDRALLDNFGHLEIIHGRGTGALRKEVHRWLRESLAVAEYTLAPEDQGGDGMTIVELK